MTRLEAAVDTDMRRLATKIGRQAAAVCLTAHLPDLTGLPQ